MSKFGLLVKYISSGLSRRSPAILTGLGIAGMAGTVVLAVKATPKAMKKIEEAKAETPKEKIKAAWKCYITTLLAGTASAACEIAAQKINGRRLAALATAYTMSETAFKEYREKVVEKLGEKKEKEVQQEVAKDRLEKKLKENPDKLPIGMMSNGNMPCYDATLGFEFISSEPKLRIIESDLNKELLLCMYVSSNEFRERVGVRHSSLGDDIGWNINDGMIDLDISYDTYDGLTYLIVTHRCAPKHKYDKFG